MLRNVRVGVAIVAAGVLLGACRATREEPAAPAVASASPGAPPSASAPVASSISAREPARVVSALPSASTSSLTAPLHLELDRSVEVDVLRRALVIKPRTEVDVTSRDGGVTISPRPRWKMGRPYRVELDPVRANGELAAFTWHFRTRVPEPGAITPGRGHRLILTFDDAPRGKLRGDAVLATLQRLGVKALLFPTGDWASEHEDWVRRAVDQGHRVCNHTRTHQNLTLRSLTDDDVRGEITGGASDGSCKLFRPPLMAVDERVERIARELGLELFLWDVDTRDWEDAPREDIENRVLGLARPDAVVLLHQHGKHTLEALPRIVSELTRAGYVLSWDPRDAHVDGGATPLTDGGAPPSWADRLRTLADDEIDGGAP